MATPEALKDVVLSGEHSLVKALGPGQVYIDMSTVGPNTVRFATSWRVRSSECYANFECRLRDTRMIRAYSLFIWEVVKAHVALSPKRPQTIHYRGEG